MCTQRSKVHTSVIPSSCFAARSPALGFLPRTASSRRSTMEPSRLGSAARGDLVSSISGASSGDLNVSWFNALRCLFALGCGIEPSFERGRCLRLEDRTEGGALLTEGENIMTRAQERPCQRPRAKGIWELMKGASEYRNKVTMQISKLLCLLELCGRTFLRSYRSETVWSQATNERKVNTQPLYNSRK